MKNILIPIEDHHSIQAVLETALLFGAIFDSYLEGLALGPQAGDFVAADFAVVGATFDEATRREIMAQARRLFENFMRAHDVPAYKPSAPGLSYGWREAEMTSDGAIGGPARLADVVVLGRPGPSPGDPRRATLESVLFDSGRPILIAPPKPPTTLGQSIVIAWNASTETARAIGFAMPLLRQARRISILTVSGAMAPGPSAEALALALARHGLTVEVVHIDNPSRAAGKIILEEAEKRGADLLIKGGYTQSRLRQMIFGGATSEILAHASLPVFMAH